MSAILLFLIFIIFSHYILYPLILFILSRLSTSLQKIDNKNLPKVTMIVAAYNEQKVIEEKINNTLQLDYPKDLLEIIVVSDGSNDATPTLVQKYSSLGVTSLHRPERRGKTAALNRAVKEASGEILIFSDANSFFSHQAIKELVSHFIDDSVGGVCGRKAIVKNHNERLASMGDTSYWNVESKIKTWQSYIGGITNADGEIFALRTELYPVIDPALINDDQIITFEVVLKNKKIVYAPKALTFEEASITIEDDFNVKRRMICGAFQAISNYPWVVNPFHGYFSLNFFFHKFLRYTMFVWIFLLLFFSSIDAIMGGVIGQFICLSSLFFFTFALIGRAQIRVGKTVHIFYIPYYYLLMNYACFKGFVKYLEGGQITGLWVKAAR